MRFLLFYIAALFFVPVARGQWADSLSAKMEEYAVNRNSDLLFVHTDKHIYTNNEFLWFSAYLLHCGKDSMTLHRFVSLALVQAGTRKCVLQQKFLMSDGHSYGSLQLPDSIAPGEYQLLASTNIVDKDSVPLALFTQALSVRSIRQPEFNAVMSITEDSTGKKELKISVRDKVTGTPVPEADLLVSVGKKEVRATTNKRGEYRQSLAPFSPDDALAPVANARIKYHGDMVYLQKALPVAEKERVYQLRFYPEGGPLLAGIPCRVGCESRTENGEPVPVKIVLLKNGLPADTFTTGDQGLGEYVLLPERDAVYSARPLQLPSGLLLKEAGFSLPAVQQKGVSLFLPRSVADDSLGFRLYAAGYRQAKLVVHNYRQIFAAEKIDINEAGRKVRVLLNNVPRGLAVITLLDSLNRPLAERLFFAHYDKKLRLQCVLDKESRVYEKRQKVTLTLQLAGKADTGFGIASIACAQANRFESRKQQDIESFTLLQSELENMPAYTKGIALDDAAYLENLLLVRGTKAGNWQKIENETPQPVFSSPGLYGKLINRTTKKNKPALLTLIGGSSRLTIITTDQQGKFDLAYDQLIMPQDKKLWIVPDTKSGDDRLVQLIDPFAAINSKMAAGLRFPLMDVNKFSQYSQDLVLKDLSVARELPTVVVTSSRNNNIYGVANKCGDYVCLYNILNCPNHPGHPGNHLPVKGKSYKVAGGGEQVYWGCTMEEPGHEAVILYEGIKIGNRFYGEDFEAMPKGTSEFISTLYWEPAFFLNSNGTATCSFYTSDLAGRFRIVVNGRTNKDLFYGTALFEVK